MLNVSIDIEPAISDVPLSESMAEKVVRFVIAGEKIDHADISIVFVSNTYIRRLNAEYLQHDYVTDVIAFNLNDPAEPIEGEVYISIEQARSQSQEYQVTPIQEVIRLIIHGVLHLIGYDDFLLEHKEIMRAKEEFYIKKI